MLRSLVMTIALLVREGDEVVAIAQKAAKVIVRSTRFPIEFSRKYFLVR